MKNILCFGDSNTWGYNGENGARFPYEKRWTSLLQKELGEGFNVIPEGLNGRTSVWEDPFSPYRNGAEALPFCLLSHAPLALVVLMLGTNDSKNFFHNTPYSIGKGVGSLIETIQASDSGLNDVAPRILLISPAVVREANPETAAFDLREFAKLGGHDPVKVSEGLASEYESKAREFGCVFLNAADYARVGPADGVHLTGESHKSLADAVAAKIREMGI